MSINNNNINNNNNKTTSTTSTILPSPVYTHPYHHPYSSLYQQHISAATTSLLSICSTTGGSQVNTAGNQISDTNPEPTASMTTVESTTDTSATSDIAAKTIADLNYSFVKRENNSSSRNNHAPVD